MAQQLHFSDAFWASDHMTSIRTLFDHLERGHAEGTATLNYFEDYTSILDLESKMFGQLAQKQKSFIDSNPISGDNNPLLTKLMPERKASSVRDVVKEQARYVTDASISRQRMFSKFQSDLVLRLKDFLDDYSDFMTDSKKALVDQYNVYVRSLHTAQSLERKISMKVRALDDLGVKHSHKDDIVETMEPIEVVVTPPVQSKDPDSPTQTSTVLPATPQNINDKSTPKTTTMATLPEEDTTSSQSPHDGIGDDDDEEDELFQFPLVLGMTDVANVEELRDLLNAMVEEIPVKRRLIPLPGVNNEYFSSEQFSQWIRTRFTHEDTRRKVEKFGQDFIDLGLMRNWNKLSSNKFVSDGAFYEFTDLARFTSKYKPGQPPVIERTEKQYPKALPKSSATTPAKKSGKRNVTPTADIWSNIRSTFTSAANADTLKSEITELESKYTEAIVSITTERTTLDIMFQDTAAKSETFETNRITMILTLTELFSESVLADHEAKAKNLTKSLQDLKFNDDTVKYEQLKAITSTNGGWYWPKTEVKFVDHSKNPKIEILDVDLVNQTMDLSDQETKTRSVPVFVKSMIRNLEAIENVGEMWEARLDIKTANGIKKKVFEWIAEHGHDSDVVVGVENVVDMLFETEEVQGILSFFKLWLLELPDSVIPFTTYDTLLKLYQDNVDKEHLVNVFSSVPRQNLATLLVICQHITKNCKITDKLVNSHNVPLYHLLMRPSPRKHHASITDSLVLEPFIYDLLDSSFQAVLHKKLVQLESLHQEREKRVQDSITRLKLERERSSAVSSPTPKKAQNLNADGLRTFKTKSPIPTPVTSPKGSRRNSTHATRSSSTSPKLKRPSDNLTKRISLLSDS
ncbi:Rho-GTPase-activating protein 8 [Cyberlindnera fabianii]|uniref:Rho-GTPase-activating protein 8 n=1 Tax=Cyberlindnera fabianii TaxID=36022 RepID=A0A1V2L0W6_CYBFA|nr:Rho-GTPase-activating protein 8 [Cyberlindnera fabianii]